MENYTPKYIVIKNYIIDKIKNGELVVGDQIPSENQLSKQFGVSRVTANAAIKELFTLGIVERIQGKGTFIKEKKYIEESLNSRIDRSSKVSSELFESRHHLIEDVSLIIPDEETREKLKLNNEDEVFKVIRLMIRDEAVVAIDYSFIPQKFLTEDEINIEVLSSNYFHEFLAESVDDELKYIRIHFDAKLPDEYEINKMEIESNYPVISFETQIVNSLGNVIAFTRTIADTKRYKPFVKFEI